MDSRSSDRICEPEDQVEQVINDMGLWAAVFVPMLALWSIVCLYTQHAGCRCCITEGAYFLALLIIAGVTVRTIMANDHCWLVHTASLGMMTVAGVMRRPASELGGDPT